MMKFIFLYIALVISAGAIADFQVPSASFNHPTERENGDPLTLSEIGGYDLYFYSQASPGIPGNQWSDRTLHYVFTVDNLGIKNGDPYIAWLETRPEPHCFGLETFDRDGRTSKPAYFCMDYSPSEPVLTCF